MNSSVALFDPLGKKAKKKEIGPKKRVLILSGPTASGKTSLSLSLAQGVGGEIVSADSVQVYQGMDIGTAKPSVEQRAGIAHHLIDICPVQNPYNVAQFYDDAQEALRGITARSNVPIVVGGSGFYIHTLLYGPPLGPPSLAHVRDQLEEQMARLGPEVLYERLQMLDPVYAATISEQDRHKIIRALEIMALSDRKVSDFPKADRLQEQDYDFRCWFIYYPRETLRQRIENRCETMIQEGFLDEVERLQKEGMEHNPSACQAIGYRQALEFLKGLKTQEDYEQFLLQFKRASYRYAKRQFTWFRREPLFRWLNLEKLSLHEISEIILQDFEQGE